MSEIINSAPHHSITPVAALKAHLAPWRWFRKFAGICSDVSVMGFFHTAEHWAAGELARKSREQAWMVHRRVPPAPVIEEARQSLRAGLAEHASPEHIVGLVAVLTSGRANFDPIRRAAFVDTMAALLIEESEMAPFSTAALAAAVYKTLTENKFVPEVPELLGAIRSAGVAMAGCADRLDRLQTAAAMARQCLCSLGDLSAEEHRSLTHQAGLTASNLSPSRFASAASASSLVPTVAEVATHG
ncbi:hypothetical protein [Xanthobacter sp. KR7-225]|uniref:hypothetical protein n=1 Tax=Xanthobacter sp. KR7-225 TaxID=3156613 RepID=UPI0032B3CFB6